MKFTQTKKINIDWKEKYKQINVDKVLKRRASINKWRLQNIEKVREISRKWHWENRERHLQNCKKYYQSHKMQYHEYYLKRKLKKENSSHAK